MSPIKSPKRRATEAEEAVIEGQEEMSRARDNLGYVCSNTSNEPNATSFTS